MPITLLDLEGAHVVAVAGLRAAETAPWRGRHSRAIPDWKVVNRPSESEGSSKDHQNPGKCVTIYLSAEANRSQRSYKISLRLRPVHDTEGAG